MGALITTLATILMIVLIITFTIILFIPLIIILTLLVISAFEFVVHTHQKHLKRIKNHEIISKYDF